MARAQGKTQTFSKNNASVLYIGLAFNPRRSKEGACGSIQRQASYNQTFSDASSRPHEQHFPHSALSQSRSMKDHGVSFENRAGLEPMDADGCSLSEFAFEMELVIPPISDSINYWTGTAPDDIDK
jgi:hypothetical protein